MSDQFRKVAHYSIVFGSVLIVLAMALHPVGGNLNHIRSIKSIIIGSHLIAIFAVVITLFGFYGLVKSLDTKNPINVFAFIFMMVGSVFVLLAASINGIALPIFADRINDSEHIKPILKLMFSLNNTWTILYILSSSISIFLWSIQFYLNKVKWVSIIGFVFSIFVIYSFITGLELTDLRGFRTFLLGIILWIVSAGIYLRNEK